MLKARHHLPVCCRVESLEDYYVKGDPKGKRRPWMAPPDWMDEIKIWQADRRLQESETMALVLARNVTLALSANSVRRQINPLWQINCLNNKNGQLWWRENLPSPALANGLLVDRDGRIVVVMQDGGVMCYAHKPEDPSKSQAKRN
jgi:hypothetical protein